MTENTNSLADVIRLALEQGQQVQAVEAMVDNELPKRPIAVKIRFETVSLCVFACGEDDTISVSDEWPSGQESEATVQICRRHDLWGLLIGAKLTWGWVMQNNLGYRDGVQLEFRREGQVGLVCIQFIAIASTLELRLVCAVQEQALPSGPVPPPSG